MHENYIADAINGVLMQETSFPVELIIANDCSTDRTDQVVQSFKTHKNYNWIKYFRHEVNKGMIPNFISALNKCNGKYIALCEGDDYWTDRYKLQKQVDFFQANEEYVASFHKVKILEKGGELEDDYMTQVPQNHETIEDLARDGNYIHTPSVIFKNVLKVIPEELYLSPVGDYFIYMLLAEQGKFKYLNDIMAVYRNGVGIHSSKTQEDKTISFNIALFLIWHVFIKTNRKIATILFKRIEGKLNQLLNNNYLIDQLTKIDKNQTNLTLCLIKQLEYSHQIEIALTKENSINDFLKSTSSFYLLKIVAYKFGLTRLIKKVD